jgi:phage-related protein
MLELENQKRMDLLTIAVLNLIVLHVFQKKSKTGIETTKQDKDFIQSRMQMAKQIYDKLCTEGKNHG